MKNLLAFLLTFSFAINAYAARRQEHVDFDGHRIRLNADSYDADQEIKQNLRLIGGASLIASVILAKQAKDTGNRYRGINEVGPFVINPATGTGAYQIDQGALAVKERYKSKNKTYRHALIGTFILGAACFSALFSYAF